MKNSNFLKNSILALIPICLGLGVLFGIQIKPVNVTNAYNGTSVSKMDINLIDTPSNSIRSYYSALNSLSASEKTGTNLLKNLKPILMKNQKYYNYDNGDAIWRLYEIIDRDWEKSPAKSAPNATYDSVNNVLKNYTFKYSTGNDAGNPYLHALYVNRDATNLKRAWGDHGNRNSEATIEREHVWPKSHGFDDTDSAAGGARGDPMHLWAADGTANGNHSNFFYGYVDKSKSYTDSGDKFSSLKGNLLGISKTVGGTLKVFEPQDSDKGDIARACFYMVARYNNYANEKTGIDVNNPNLRLSDNNNSRTGTSTYNDPFDLGILTDLLEWNRIDPPDEFEIHRNNLLYTNFTNNRNPFIDFPEWADICFGNSQSSADPASDNINGQGISKTLKSITVTTNPSKTVYTEGESFSTNGMVVTATYSDNSTENVSNFTFTPSGPLALGTEKITVTYEGKTAEIEINVIPQSSELIRYFEKVESNLTSGSYLIACAELGVAWKTGLSGSANTIKVGFDDSDHIVYTEELGNALFNFNLTNGSIYAPNKKYIYQDENAAGVKLSDTPVANTISVNDGVLTIEGSGGRVLKCNENKSNPTFNFYTKSSTYNNVNVYRLVEKSEIIHPTSVVVSPSSLELEVGNSQKLSATVLPSDATNKTVRWVSANPEIASVDSTGRVVANSSGSTTIKAISNDSEVDVFGSCTVVVPEQTVLDRLEISGSYKTVYYVGDEFSKSGLVVSAVFSKGKVDQYSEDVTDDAEFSGFDSSEPGEKTITVSFNGFETTFSISVFAVPVEQNTIKIVTSTYGFENSASVTTISKDNFDVTFSKGTNTYNSPKYYTSGSAVRVYAGNTFTITGPYKIESIKLVLGSANDNEIIVDKGTFDATTGVWSNSSAVDNLTFSIGGLGGHRKIEEIHIKYDPSSTTTKELLSISLSGDYQTVFNVGDDFNCIGLVVNAHYNDGSESVVTPDSVSGENMDVDGEQEINVSYTENGVTKEANYTITVNKVILLDCISLSGSYKTEFFVGDKFSRDGLKVTAHYTDGSSKEVSPSSVSGANMNIPSESQTITVIYGEDNIEKSATYTIKVKDILPTSLSVTDIEQTKYVCGDVLNENFATIVTYNNGTTQKVTPTRIDGYDMSVSGEQTVSVTYTEKDVSVSTTYNIQIDKLMPENIAISGDFTKNFYTNEEFNYEGLIATVSYNNGTTATVTPTVSTPDMETSGTKKVTVSYSLNDKTVSTSYNITVTQLAPTKIELSGNYKTEFFKDDTFDSTGLIVKATFNRGETTTVTDYEISSPNMSVVSNSVPVTISYTFGGVTKTASYNIKITAKLVSITVDQMCKDEYFVGDTFDSTGLIVKAHYNDNTSKPITADYEVPSLEEAGTKVVELTYKENDIEVKTQITITVNEILPAELRISGSYKKDFFKGDDFDSTGLVATLVYNNGTTKVVTPVITGYDKNVVGEQTITVKYTEKEKTVSTTYTIIVKPVDLVRIEVSGLYKTEFEYGEEFSTEGLVLNAKYSNNTTRVVMPSSIEGYDSTKVGYQVISVSYTEGGITKQTTYQVKVKAKQSNESSNVPLIAGAVGGGAVGFGVIITIICVVLKKKH